MNGIFTPHFSPPPAAQQSSALFREQPDVGISTTPARCITMGVANCNTASASPAEDPIRATLQIPGISRTYSIDIGG